MPSKKVFGLLILVTSFVISIILIFNREKVSQAINYATTLTPGEALTLPENTNWQNELNNTLQETRLATSSPDKNNKTDTVSQTLIYNYLALKQNNTLNDESASNLVNQIGEYVLNQNTKEITEKDIIIIKDNSKKAIEDYGETLGLVLKNNKGGEFTNELVILERALNNQNPAELKDLDKAMIVYNKIGENMLKVRVPEIFAKAHINMINGMFALSTSLEEIKKVFDDPFSSLQGVEKYQNNGFKFLQEKQAVAQFLKQKEITYKQGSGGYYLIYGI